MQRLLTATVLILFVIGAGKAQAGPAQSGQAIAFALVSGGNLLNFGGNGTKSAQASSSGAGLYTIEFHGNYPKNVFQCTIPTVTAFNNGHGEVADIQFLAFTNSTKSFSVGVVLFESASELNVDGTVSVAVYCGNPVN